MPNKRALKIQSVVLVYVLTGKIVHTATFSTRLNLVPVPLSVGALLDPLPSA